LTGFVALGELNKACVH